MKGTAVDNSLLGGTRWHPTGVQSLTWWTGFLAILWLAVHVPFWMMGFPNGWTTELVQQGAASGWDALGFLFINLLGTALCLGLAALEAGLAVALWIFAFMLLKEVVIDLFRLDLGRDHAKAILLLTLVAGLFLITLPHSGLGHLLGFFR